MQKAKQPSGIAVISEISNSNCVKKRRKHENPHKALIKETIYEYATNTTIHGLSYTIKRDINLVEKIFWMFTIISSLCLCGYMSHEVWIKWQTRPIMVTFSEKMVSVTEVPFPSITICPQTKIKKSVYNYAAEYKRLEKVFTSTYDKDIIMSHIEDIVKSEDISQICHDSGLSGNLRTWMHFDIYEKEELSHTSAAENIMKVAPKKEDIFHLCIWRDWIDRGCENTLSEVLTSEGLCFNLNSLAVHDIMKDDINVTFNARYDKINWTMEHGYSYISPYAYPTPGKEMEASPDLRILFRDREEEHDELCNILNMGYNKIFVHHPADLPQASNHFSSVQSGEATSIAISFNVISTSESLKNYLAELRQCYMPDERKLKYFKTYTENNCKMECFVNHTYEKYNCVLFYMPHDNTTRICTHTEGGNVITGDHSYEPPYDLKQCHCLPSCFFVDYDTETLKTVYNLQKWFGRHVMVQGNLSDYTYSSLQMYFKKPSFLSMRRQELFGVTDFLANIGGILSLFLGFSFLSLVELLYYATLRLYFIFKKNT